MSTTATRGTQTSKRVYFHSKNLKKNKVDPNDQLIVGTKSLSIFNPSDISRGPVLTIFIVTYFPTDLS